MNRNQIAKVILMSLVASGAVILAVTIPQLPIVLKLFGKGPDLNRRLGRSLRGLEKQKLVRVYQKNGVDVVEITKNGQKKVLSYKLSALKIVKQKKWDGYWRVVIFDIPENKKFARRALSFKLKEMGFYHLQKSCFVSPYNCKKEVDFIGEYFNVRDDIDYILASKIEGQSKLKNFFGLK